MNLDFENLSDAEFMEALRQLAQEWKRRFKRRLGVTPELAEFYACEKLELTHMPPENRGFDATDRSGKRYQIKGRAPDRGDTINPQGRVGRFMNFDFDYALLVIIDSDLRCREIWRASAEKIKVEQAKVRNERAGIHVGTFQEIGERLDC